jgi:hypothetical protein
VRRVLLVGAPMVCAVAALYGHDDEPTALTIPPAPCPWPTVPDPERSIVVGPPPSVPAWPALLNRRERRARRFRRW